MRAVIQRVANASVKIEGRPDANINEGLLILLGIQTDDTKEDIDWLANKITKMRIFSDENDLMNKSVLDIDGDLLLISQFTLHASTKKGNRPSFLNAAKPDIAIPLYEESITQFNRLMPREIKTGIFGADMKVQLLNDGPVTITIDSKNKE